MGWILDQDKETDQELVLEPLPPESRKSYQEVVAAIRQRQRVRGHQPLTREEVDAYLNEERESWGP